MLTTVVLRLGHLELD